MSEGRGVRRQKQTAIRLAREGVEGALDVTVVLDEGWRYLLEKGQPLADDALLILQQSSEITVWPRQIANEARADWVGDVDKNDRDHARFSMQGAGSLPGMCEHHFWPQRHQLFRQR